MGRREREEMRTRIAALVAERNALRDELAGRAPAPEPEEDAVEEESEPEEEPAPEEPDGAQS